MSGAIEFANMTRESERAVRILEQAEKKDDGGELFARVFDAASAAIEGMQPEIRSMVLSNYRAAGLGKWNDPDKGLMESEINRGLVSLRKRTTGRKGSQGWYVRFEFRPEARHYLTRRKDGTTRERNIHLVAHSLSYGAVHTRGLGTRASFSPETGKRLDDVRRLSGDKMRRTVKKAALKVASSAGLGMVLSSPMSKRQRIPFVEEIGGGKVSLDYTYKGRGIRFNVEVDGGSSQGLITVIPPRPFLLFTASQKTGIMLKVYAAVKAAITQEAAYVG